MNDGLLFDDINELSAVDFALAAENYQEKGSISLPYELT